MADQDGWTADAPERAPHAGNVTRKRVEAVLAGDDLVALCLKRLHQLC